MLDQTSYKTIAIEKRDDGVAVATLNRPERLNAVNGDLHHELTTLPRDADADDAVRALVITGAGRAFCAGGDFSPNTTPIGAHGTPAMEEGRRVVDHLLECRKPVVSAVNGYAMGLGATMALLADVVVAGRSAVFADTHVVMGIGAGDGGQLIWPLLVGVNKAKYFLMTGDRVGAEEAERIGLVNFVVEDDELLERALAIATRLAQGPTAAISASKMAINAWMRSISSTVMPLSLSLEEANFHTADHKEAVKAFNEKRAPKFIGR
ncbi:MAG: enoyl-CoA hydratase/isomerase family protein [Acidimicrobiia bacterium]|nr:enoyl-CoA hydratase/isomerase family protein [Acidimicrobiia bacterium]